MPRKVFRGVMLDGKLDMDMSSIGKYLEQFKEGTKLSLILEKTKKPRSSNQNKYYWGVVVEIVGQELGYTDKEAHEALRAHFLKSEDEHLPKVKSTKTLSTVEFESYMTLIRRWATVELNLYIPLPNETEFNY